MLSDKLLKLHAVVPGDHLRCFFADHDRRRIGVPAGHVGHDARIGHAQLSHPQHPEARINDVADPAGAGVVVDG